MSHSRPHARTLAALALAALRYVDKPGRAFFGLFSKVVPELRNAPAGGSRRTIGFLTTETSATYNAALIATLAAVCAERDVNLVVFTDAYLSREHGMNACRVFAARLAGPDNVDAMIVPVLGNTASEEQVLAFVERFRPLPVCTISLTLPGYPNVQVDNEAGLRGVVRHLVEVHGYRRFVFLGRPPEHIEGRIRRKAYLDALASYGIEPLPEIVVPGDPALDPSIILRGLADLGKVDAVVAVDDYVVPPLMQVLAALERRVPEDVAVTGFDDSDIARGNNPPLTTVRQPFYAMVNAAIESVLERLDGIESAPVALVPPELVLRASCGCGVQDTTVYPAALLDGLDVAQALAQARADIVTEWAQIAGLRIGVETWADALYSALTGDLLGGTGMAVASSSELSSCLVRHTARGGEPHVWGSVLNVLRRRVSPLVAGDPVLLARADALIYRLGAQVTGAEAGRAHGLRIHSEVLAREHAVVAERLLRDLDRKHLLSALPELFLRLGVDTFWFSEYPDPMVPEAGARLVSAMVAEQPLALSADAAPFRPSRLVPEEQRPRERFSWVVSPVHDEEHQLGLLVATYVREPGVTYDIMALQIGAALHGALLMRRVADETERRERAERERLVRELELAQRIQTSILPRDLNVPGLEIATVMVPATEVGGDYFDVLPVADGCFLGIGDVAGHGLNTGLVMLMVQSAVAAAFALMPTLPPSAVVTATNRVLYDNVRNRLGQNEHITLTLLRYETSGRLRFAGAHEDLLVYRARTNEVEVAPVTGVWSGVLPDVSELTTDETLQLEPGDVLLLYTDGATEAISAERELFGIDRLKSELQRVGRQPVDAIRDHLLSAVRAFQVRQEDDIALVVARHLGT